MQHGFCESEWLAYLEGRLGGETFDRMERHVKGCAECADFVRRSQQWERQIVKEARAIGEERFASPDRVEELLLSALDRLAAEQAGRLRPSSAILLLRHLLAPLLGRRVADGFIELAIGRASSAEAEGIDAQTWPVFVEQLRIAAGSLGGAHTERMIERAGARLAAEMI